MTHFNGMRRIPQNVIIGTLTYPVQNIITIAKIWPITDIKVIEHN